MVKLEFSSLQNLQMKKQKDLNFFSKSQSKGLIIIKMSQLTYKHINLNFVAYNPHGFAPKSKIWIPVLHGLSALIWVLKQTPMPETKPIAWGYSPMDHKKQNA